MAYASHLRLTVTGVLGPRATPVETFSFGMALVDQANLGGMVSNLTQAQFDGVATAIQTWFASAGARITPSASITEVRCAWIGQNGLVVRSDSGAYEQLKRLVTTGAAGTVNTVFHPFQVAAVASLTTPRAGAAGRGRIYLPAPGISVGTDGRMAASDAAGLATSVAGLITSINGATGGAKVGVASQGSVLKGLPPVNTVVTGVRVGRVLDTLRTRRRSQVEEYATAAV